MRVRSTSKVLISSVSFNHYSPVSQTSRFSGGITFQVFNRQSVAFSLFIESVVWLTGKSLSIPDRSQHYPAVSSLIILWVKVF